ncbi:MAG: hypothetical protein ACJ71H_15685 [Nitrososphaeraceae archaeon]
MSTRQHYDKKHQNLDNSFKDSLIRLGLSAAHILRCVSDKKARFKAVTFSENEESRILTNSLINSKKRKEARSGG